MPRGRHPIPVRRSDYHAPNWAGQIHRGAVEGSQWKSQRVGGKGERAERISAKESDKDHESNLWRTTVDYGANEGLTTAFSLSSVVDRLTEAQGPPLGIVKVGKLEGGRRTRTSS